jgi:hypothetical protein
MFAMPLRLCLSLLVYACSAVRAGFLGHVVSAASIYTTPHDPIAPAFVVNPLYGVPAMRVSPEPG